MKPRKQTPFFSLLLLLCVCPLVSGSRALAASQKQSLEWIPFYWQDDTISGKYVETAYLYIPVKIEDLPQDFSMQFDLGTPFTQFYENALKPYLEQSALLANKLGPLQSTPDRLFQHVKLRMGTVDFTWNVRYREDFGEEAPEKVLDSKNAIRVGTVAPDLFQHKILIIDYKASRLALADSLPAEYRDLPAEKFELVNGMIYLPFRINGSVQKVLFDTGSSPFPLATTRERALEIADPVIVDSLSGPLWWGEQITFYGMQVTKPIEFGGKVLNSSLVYYDKEGLWKEGVFDPFNIWGLTGNAYFLDRVVIIDYKNNLFRIQ